MKFLTHNFGWKVLSLAAATLVWISVASDPELATFISVPVEYKNLAQDMEISSDVVENVFLEVRGPAGELRGIPGYRPRYAVVLDMTGVEPGQHTFTIDSGDIQMPRGIQLVRAIPAQLRMTFEASATRSVPVEVRFGDPLPATLRVVEAVAEPSALAVTGPTARVARIAFVATDPVNVKPEPGTAMYYVSAQAGDPRVRFQDSARVTVKVTVAKN